MIRGGQLALGAALAVPVLLASLKPSMLDLWPPHFAPVAGYNPVDDIKGWGDQSYFLQDGTRFLASQSPAEAAYIRKLVDADRVDAPQRSRRLQVVLTVELLIIGLVSILFLFRRLLRIDHIGVLAAGLRLWQKGTRSVQAVGRQVRERAEKDAQ